MLGEDRAVSVNTCGVYASIGRKGSRIVPILRACCEISVAHAMGMAEPVRVAIAGVSLLSSRRQAAAVALVINRTPPGVLFLMLC